MTAQNMGKKILSEAGYEVVAVSNGAAAVKKIAEQKPDIIILDVYMPGYSGLEVCEKVRKSIDTVKTPVLLTVGKMEPYKPEDANRVKADGVIIKPFEASDLLAIIKKFEERIALTPPPPMVVQAAKVEPKYQEEELGPEPPMETRASGRSSVQPMVEVPDHMASSSAFGDLLGVETPNAPQHFAVNTPSAAFETSVIVPAPPVLVSSENEIPSAWQEQTPEPIVLSAVEPVQQQAEEQIIAVEAVPEPQTEVAEAFTLSEPAPLQVEAAPVVNESEPQPSRPQFIPIFKEPEPASVAQSVPEAQPAAATYEVVPTAAARVDDVEIPREPALQETAEETTRTTVVDHVEPGLMSPLEQVEAAPTGPTEPVGMSAVEAPAPVVEAPMESSSVQTPVAAAAAEVSDADFEARVAAAMAAYSHVVEAAVSPASAPEIPAPAAPQAETIGSPVVYVETASIAETPQVTAEPAPSFEYQPPIRVPEATIEAHVESSPAIEVTQEAPTPAPVSHEPEQVLAETPEPIHQNTVVATVESALPAVAAAAAAETGAEHHTIAQAVHRVMERLKPELVEEIMRELRSKK
jgi:CheY-like chemotaxis protein